jgi:hypothetical protein
VSKVQSKVAGGVYEDQEPYPRGKQGVERGESIECDGEPEVPRRRPRDIHAPPAPVPCKGGREEGECREGHPHRRRQGGPTGAHEHHRGRREQSHKERQEHRERVRHRERRQGLSPEGAGRLSYITSSSKRVVELSRPGRFSYYPADNWKKTLYKEMLGGIAERRGPVYGVQWVFGKAKLGGHGSVNGQL